jgi:hypothetical protein
MAGQDCYDVTSPLTFCNDHGMTATIVGPLFRGTGRFFTEDRPDLTEAPSIRLVYGMADHSLHELDGSFAGTGLAELRLGHSDVGELEGGITSYESSELCLAGFSTEVGGDAEEDEIDARILRVSLSSTDGYGYDFGRVGIVPYYTGALCLSKMELEDEPASEAAKARMDRFGDSFRFGTKFEGGVRMMVGKHVELGAGYERSLIFPRWLFWKWAGSEILESAVLGFVDEFVDEIRGRTPAAAPIVSFVLKNGVSYAVYELRKEDMNYPFSTEDPILSDSFTFSLAFVF